MLNIAASQNAFKYLVCPHFESPLLVSCTDQFLFLMHPAALSKKRVWTFSIVKLQLNYKAYRHGVAWCCADHITQESKLVPTITDHHMSTGPSFPSESVHTLFQDEAMHEKFGLGTFCVDLAILETHLAKPQIS